MATEQLEVNGVADDPAALQQAFERLEAGEDLPATTTPEPEHKADGEAAAAGTESGAAAKAEPGKEQAATEEGKPEPKPETDPEPKGVATKDGQHVIPYSVLKGERDRATRAEQLARESQERVTALEQQLKAGSEGAKAGEGARTDGKPAGEAVSEEDMAALKEDFPTVYKALQASMARATELEAKLKPVEDSVRNVEQQRAQATANAVQDAIDATPKLAHIQATDAAAFKLAQQFDSVLRGQPAWADKPLAERFAKVVQMVEDASGPIEGVADAKAEAAAKPETTPQKAGDLSEQAKALAAQKAKAAGAGVPATLSEFPAGEAAAADEAQAAEQMSHGQLAAKFAGMTTAQMDAYLQDF